MPTKEQKVKELVERVKLTDKEIDNEIPSKEDVLEYMKGLNSGKVEGWDSMSEKERLLTAFGILSCKNTAEAQLNKVLNDPDLALKIEYDDSWYLNCKKQERKRIEYISLAEELKEEE